MSLVTASRNIVTRIGHGDAQAPRRFGKYRVLFELGRGGMATVYLAVTQSAGGVNKLVVLKALLPQFAAEPEARAMFLDEARLAAQLNHGSVVQTYEAGQEDDSQVIVMEYLEGQSLASLLKRGHKRAQPLPLGLHLRVLMQVLEGLHYTHELRGYDGAPLRPVHRDVSPQNVFVTYDGRTKLLDFGIAKAATSTTHTAAGLIKGKIAYMSPEQMAGGAVDRRADIFAVGCMLWAAATGRKLWADATDVNILHDVVQNAIPVPRSRNPDCDPELERIVMKALARIDDRYSSALELHDDLERFCEARAIPERPRELARVMAEWFAEDRAELTARIERELSRPEAESVVATTVDPSTTHLTPSTGEPQVTTSTRTISAATVNAVPVKSRGGRRRRVPVIAAGVVALALATYWVLSHETREPALVSKGERMSAAGPTAEPPQTAANVELRALPLTAQLYLDDEPLSGNPVRRAFPKGGIVHRLRAEQAGYISGSAEFTTDSDRTVELQLAPSHAVRAPGKQSGGARNPQRPPVAKPPSPALKAPNCAQPFYMGADGVKRIKPECL